MTLRFIGHDKNPNYIASVNDIVNSKIEGATNKGYTVLTMEDGAWYIINDDLSLHVYALPVGLNGTISIGAVNQGNAGAEAWLVDGSGVTQPVSGDFLTDAELRANPVPISGALTDSQLRASPVPVSGTLTDSQLRATPVPISGALTDSQLRASPVAISTPNGIQIGDGSNLDAFSRLRVSSPKTIFNSSFRYDLQPLIFEQITATGGTVAHDANLVSAHMAVNTSNGSSVALQSRQYHRYIPAKSQMIAMTQVVGAAVANVRKRAGYFDASNGIFLEQNGTTDVAFVRRTSTSGSPVDNRVVQANWNLDKLDGNGASGVTLDLSKDSILIIDLQWLGMGRVRVGFDINGRIVYCHEFLSANILSSAYMQTGSLPVRWEITNTAASAGGNMYAGCSAVLSEGGDEQTESYAFSIANTADVSATTSRTPLLAIRPKATFNSIVNRIEISLGDFSIFAGNNPVLVELVYNPSSLSVTGGWTSVDANSSVEYHPTITAISGGIVVSSFFVASSNATRGTISSSTKGRLPLTLDAAGTNPIPVVICATSFSATSACRGRIDWIELK